MNSDVMAIDEQMVTQNNGIYGSNRISYLLYVMSLCANTVNYDTGKLQAKSHKRVTYDLAQNFPDDELSAALLSTQTELAQAQGVPNTFEYCQSAEAVEFIVSNMANVDITNIDAAIIKNLLKKYDYYAWNGAAGNFGLVNNPNAVTTSGVANDGSYSAFKLALDEAISRMRTDIGLTRSEWLNVTISFNEPISIMLGNIEGTSDLSNFEKLEKAYPNMMFREAPDNLIPNTPPTFVCSYAPMLTFHRASIPSKYNEERGKHGLSTENLYTFETNAVEIESLGAVQIVDMIVTAALAAKMKADAKAAKK